LDVQRSNGTAKIRVEETNGTTSNRTLLELVNQGSARIALTNDAFSTTWVFGTPSDDFEISRDGSGSSEFNLDQNGNLEITGTLTENSDVNAKENFTPVNPHAVLERVLELPITTWNYKTDADGVRNLGPMAQDFYAAFGLGGTDKGIAPRNLAAVALAAIQGMNEVVAEKDAQIEELSARLAALEKLLATAE
jgi:hypothetical protein